MYLAVKIKSPKGKIKRNEVLEKSNPEKLKRETNASNTDTMPKVPFRGVHKLTVNFAETPHCHLRCCGCSNEYQ